MRTTLVIPAILCTMVGNAVAAEQGIPPQVQRPPDMTTERVERPQRSPTDSPDALHAILTQAEVIRLAKAAAKKEKGKTFDDYDLKSVTSDPTTREWTVSFDPKPPRRASEECLLVIVKDDTRETKVLRC
jgi:hypothetical protein